MSEQIALLIAGHIFIIITQSSSFWMLNHFFVAGLCVMRLFSPRNQHQFVALPTE
jgi:hypothetical protein